MVPNHPPIIGFRIAFKYLRLKKMYFEGKNIYLNFHRLLNFFNIFCGPKLLMNGNNHHSTLNQFKP